MLPTLLRPGRLWHSLPKIIGVLLLLISVYLLILVSRDYRMAGLSVTTYNTVFEERFPVQFHKRENRSADRSARKYVVEDSREDGAEEGPEQNNDSDTSTTRTTTFGDPSEFDCDKEFCYINGRKIKKVMLRETPEDMFKILPPAEEGFLKEFKNPCWKDSEGKLMCIPYFYIIGFTKCGTTDLYSILAQHSQIFSRYKKEPHYFDRLRRGRGPRMHREPSGLPMSFAAWVNLGKYQTHIMNTYTLQPEKGGIFFPGITMDATPATVWDDEFWEAFHLAYQEPPVTSADVISAIRPQTKIIVSLRDPIKRMQSAYQFFCAYHVYRCDAPVTNVKFHRLVVEAISMFNKCLESNTVRGCVYSTDAHQLATHLYASIYSVYLKDWLAAFPKHQIYVVKMEEHVQDQVDSVNSICDFLEIPRFDGDVLTDFLDQHKVRNSLKDEKRIPYILPETMEILNRFFKPYLRDLVELLGDDKWSWDYEL